MNWILAFSRGIFRKHLRQDAPEQDHHLMDHEMHWNIKNPIQVGKLHPTVLLTLQVHEALEQAKHGNELLHVSLRTQEYDVECVPNRHDNLV